MKNNMIMIIGIIIALIIGFIIGNMVGNNHHEFATNDGMNGCVFFENISNEVGYGIYFKEGLVPLNVSIYKGSLKIKILKGEDTVYETELEKGQDVVANIPEKDYYTVMLSGKNATGLLKYPVFGVENDDINNIPDIIK